MTTPQVFYKATRPDGTDFYSGTILYKVGRRVRPAKYVGPRKICGPGLLHASTIPAMSLVGGSWPCRLFEVTGRPVAGLNSKYPYKAGFLQLRVEQEIPSHLSLGPNGEAVIRLLDRAKILETEEIYRLTAASYAAGGKARRAAWDAARRASRRAAWNAASYAARNAASYAARNAASYAVRDAAWALVVRDLLPEKHFTTLTHVWVEATESID
jgi:hypothetical protein